MGCNVLGGGGGGSFPNEYVCEAILFFQGLDALSTIVEVLDVVYTVD